MSDHILTVDGFGFFSDSHFAKGGSAVFTAINEEDGGVAFQRRFEFEPKNFSSDKSKWTMYFDVDETTVDAVQRLPVTCKLFMDMPEFTARGVSGMLHFDGFRKRFAITINAGRVAPASTIKSYHTGSRKNSARSPQSTGRSFGMQYSIARIFQQIFSRWISVAKENKKPESQAYQFRSEGERLAGVIY